MANSKAYSTGNRLKSARMLSGLSRKAFAEKNNISVATLRAWEEPTENRNGLSIKGAKRVINALSLCNIYCSEEWLINGYGPGPKLINQNYPIEYEGNFNEQESWTREEALIKDIESFKINNKDSIVVAITDDSMQPFFQIGDFVGGYKVYDENVKNLVGLNCIVEIEDRLLIRRISSFDNKNLYTLTAINHNKIDSNFVMTNAKIKYAAEIIWHRYRTRSKN